MPDPASDLETTRPVHGRQDLPGVSVESYNLELRDEDGFLGDNASETAFRQLLDDWRERMTRSGGDPLGSTPTEDLDRDDLDRTLEGEGDESAGVLDETIETFSRELAGVLQRFLATRGWAGVERVVCGGGLRSSRIGGRVIERADRILKAEGSGVSLCALRHDPDDGGMIGWVHAAPPPVLERGEAILAVDIGGTNLRCGVVVLNRDAAPLYAEASVRHRMKWRHAGEEPDREETVAALVDMLRKTVAAAAGDGIRLAPFVGLSCPGVILADGRIDRGVQNLPGDWTADEFHLPDQVARALPGIDGRPVVVMMHNDAVMQGLSQRPFMQDVRRWGAVTIGTGLGNCSFRNRAAPESGSERG